MKSAGRCRGGAKKLHEASVFLLWGSVVGDRGLEPTELPTSQNLADVTKT